MEKLKCPICSGKSHDYFITSDLNRKISNVKFKYRKCNLCKTIFLSNIPQDLDVYYADEYYQIPSQEKFLKIVDKNQSKLKIVKKYIKSGDLIEVGSAFGVFAFQASQSGFRVKSVEMNEKCCNFLRGIDAIEVIKSADPVSTLNSVSPNDVVVAWHVIEHLQNPLEFFKSAVSNLKKDGILVLATPNPDSFQLRFLGRNWPHIDAPRHLTLLPIEVLEGVAENCGLTRIGLEINDAEGLMWNAFGWQRLLMNRFKSKVMQILCFYFGYILSIIFYPFERVNFSGSAYTIIFKKN